jgi:hypothetical protein
VSRLWPRLAPERGVEHRPLQLGVEPPHQNPAVKSVEFVNPAPSSKKTYLN